MLLHPKSNRIEQLLCPCDQWVVHHHQSIITTEQSVLDKINFERQHSLLRQGNEQRNFTCENKSTNWIKLLNLLLKYSNAAFVIWFLIKTVDLNYSEIPTKKKFKSNIPEINVIYKTLREHYEHCAFYGWHTSNEREKTITKTSTVWIWHNQQSVVVVVVVVSGRCVVLYYYCFNNFFPPSAVTSSIRTKKKKKTTTTKRSATFVFSCSSLSLSTLLNFFFHLPDNKEQRFVAATIQFKHEIGK